LGLIQVAVGFDAVFTATNVLAWSGFAMGGNGGSGQLSAGIGGNGEGGGFATPQNFNNGGKASLTDVLFLGDQAVGGNAGSNSSGVLDGCGGWGLGGGIWSGPLENLTLHTVSIVLCRAQGGTGTPGPQLDGSGIGGGLYISDGLVNNTVDTFIDAITLSLIFGNHASTQNDNISGVYNQI
jgi:hypothetical protein